MDGIIWILEQGDSGPTRRPTQRSRNQDKYFNMLYLETKTTKSEDMNNKVVDHFERATRYILSLPHLESGSGDMNFGRRRKSSPSCNRLSFVSFC